MATAGFQLLPPTVITTAGTVVGSTLDLKANGMKLPLNMAAQSTFTYGSGGTSVDVWVQTSFDGGVTWQDVLHFPQLTTSSARQVGSANRQGNKVPAAAADAGGSGATGVANDGLFGPLWRVKYTSVGVYAGGTTIQVNISGEN